VYFYRSLCDFRRERFRVDDTVHFPRVENQGKKVLTAMRPNFSPVTIENLRKHFRTTYKLNEEQVDLMVVSSARSLQTAFLAVDEIQGNEEFCKKIAAIAHSLKGLLLNMGQHDWASYAAEIENAANTGKDCDYKIMVDDLRLGLRNVSTILKSP
jgi:hypothetical protein